MTGILSVTTTTKTKIKSALMIIASEMGVAQIPIRQRIWSSTAAFIKTPKAAVQGDLSHGESAEDTDTLVPNSSVRRIENLMQDERQKNAESIRLPPVAPKRSGPATVSDSEPSETTDEDNEVPLSGLHEEDHGNFTLYGMGIALGNDALDEERYQKLKGGFIRLFV